MKLKDILFDVNLMVPNDINDETKVRWLNEQQRQLYRDFGFPDTSFAFQTTVGTQLYPLPENCSRERILSLVIDDQDYEYVSMDEDVKDQCWTIIEGNLWIYPEPRATQQAFLVYKPLPADIRIDMMEEEPEFPRDFHEVLVYGVAKRVANSLQQYDTAANMHQYMLQLQDEAKKKLRQNNRKKVVQTRLWR